MGWKIEVLKKECKEYVGVGKWVGRDFEEEIGEWRVWFVRYIRMGLEKGLCEYERMGEVLREMEEEVMGLRLWKRVVRWMKRVLEVVGEDVGVRVDEMRECVMKEEEGGCGYVVMGKGVENRENGKEVG